VLEHTSNFLSRLNGVVKTGNGWDACCPCRGDDENPSLSVAEERDGKILVYCHRGGGCGANEIVTSVGLTLADLMPPSERVMPMGSFDARKDKPIAVAKPKKKEKLTLVSEYDYYDENGVLLFQKRRFVNESGKKTFFQRSPDGVGGWVNNIPDEVPRILYNLPAVIQAKKKGHSIWVVEGEKDADTLTAMGGCATTMPNGAGTWKQIHTDALAGATVDIIADNDEAGKKHATYVLSELKKAGCDVVAWIPPQGKDVTDFLLLGGQTEELIRFTPTDEDQIPMEEVEEFDDTEEEEDTEPMSMTDVAIDKLRQLLLRDDISTKALINRASLLISSAQTSGITTQGRLVNWEDFVAETDVDTYEWLIPGLLERRERVIVVAAEGIGKTMLARQVAITTSWGVQPFTFQRMPAIRTLTVDLENPEKIIRRSTRSIIKESQNMGYSLKGRAHLLIKPDGLNLLSANDRLLLENHMDEIQPELLVLGPLYKSFTDPGTKTSEAVIIEVVKYLDTLRTVYNCALWLEHHAPLGETLTNRVLRPMGSAVWSRWPEFGISLQPDPTSMGEYVYDVKHFRGERDERHWPTKMKRGKRWPFEPLEFKRYGDDRA
jgi:hypothetical protein